MAANTTKPAKTMQEPHVMAMKQAPLKAQKPTGEVEIAEAITPAPTQVAANLPQKLPKTASPLPLIGLIGLLSLGTAGWLRRSACAQEK
jgi:LPXTG-motif cell wall-anchored protein